LGYSARYHAASLVAVFLALAVGILIGAGLGDNLVSGAEDDLRDSLERDIDDAQGDANDLQLQLDRERSFSSQAYPALVNRSMRGLDIGVMAFGDLSTDLGDDISTALEPTGADLVEVAVVRRPPDVAAIGSELTKRQADAIDADPAELETLGEVLGRQFVLGRGRLLARTRDDLFSRSSGEGGRLDAVILVRATPGEELDEDDLANSVALETGLTKGVAELAPATVAVERSDAGESSIPFFEPFPVATVDSVDLVSGRVALVFTLLGADGSFGIKDSAQSLLPELLAPSGG
jgi:hypothetical protein